MSAYLKNDLCGYDEVKADYPGLSRWALNGITSVLIGEVQRETEDRRGGGNVTLEAETGVTWSQLQGRWQPPEAGRGKRLILSSSLWRSTDLLTS